MKKLITILVLFLSLVGQAQKQTLQLLQEITYPVRTLNRDVLDRNTPLWHERLDPSAHYHLFTPILEAAKKGELVVYRPIYPYTAPMTKAELDSVLSPTFLVPMYDDQSFEETMVKMKDETHYGNITGLEFHEEWYLDTVTNTFQKKIKGIILLKINPELPYMITHGQRLFYLPLNEANTKEIINEKNRVTACITYDVRIMNQDESSRETRWWAENLEPSKRELLRAATFDRAEQGKLAVYYPQYPFTRQLNGSELDKVFIRHDTVLVEDFETREMVPVPLTLKINSYSINSIRFHEEWYFDPLKMAMHKTVKGIVLLEDRAGEYNYPYHDLFYVPLNGNVPQELKTPQQADVNRISYMITADDAGITVKGLDTSLMIAKLGRLAASVKKGEKVVYQPVSASDVDPPALVPSGPVDWQKHFEGADTIIAETENGQEYQVLEWKLPPSATRGMHFTESWHFDPARYTFTKQVNSIDLVVKRDFSGHDLLVSVFNVPMNPAHEKTMRKEELLGKNIESDVLLETWINGELYYNSWWRSGLEPSKSIAIVQKMLDDLFSGEIKGYDPVTREKLANAAVKKLLVYSEEDYSSGQRKLVEKPLTHQQVSGLRFYEEWYFDEGRNMFLKKVKGIALLVRHPEKEALQPIVYIKMKN